MSSGCRTAYFRRFFLAKNAKSAASQQAPSRGRIRSTTVICVRRNGEVVMAADGQ